jgi:hypothetical protein
MERLTMAMTPAAESIAAELTVDAVLLSLLQRNVAEYSFEQIGDPAR